MVFELHEIIGLLGAFLYLYTYARIQIRGQYAMTMEYSLLNFLAAAFVMYYLTANWNLSSAVIQSTWMMISSYGLYKCFKFIKIQKMLKKAAINAA